MAYPAHFIVFVSLREPNDIVFDHCIRSKTVGTGVVCLLCVPAHTAGVGAHDQRRALTWTATEAEVGSLCSPLPARPGALPLSTLRRMVNFVSSGLATACITLCVGGPLGWDGGGGGMLDPMGGMHGPSGSGGGHFSGPMMSGPMMMSGGGGSGGFGGGMPMEQLPGPPGMGPRMGMGPGPDMGMGIGMGPGAGPGGNFGGMRRGQHGGDMRQGGLPPMPPMGGGGGGGLGFGFGGFNDGAATVSPCQAGHLQTAQQYPRVSCEHRGLRALLVLKHTQWCPRCCRRLPQAWRARGLRRRRRRRRALWRRRALRQAGARRAAACQRPLPR